MGDPQLSASETSPSLEGLTEPLAQQGRSLKTRHENGDQLRCLQSQAIPQWAVDDVSVALAIHGLGWAGLDGCH